MERKEVNEIKKHIVVRLDTSFKLARGMVNTKYAIYRDGVVEISPEGITHFLNIEQIEGLAEKIKELREAEFFEVGGCNEKSNLPSSD